jgi:hypothetical protein
MKFQHIFLATIATLSLTLSSDSKAAHADLARGTDIQIHRSINSDKYQETATSGNRTRSMEAFSLGWTAYEKKENLNALAHFYQAYEIDETNPYGYLGLGLVSGKTSEEGIAFMKAAATLFEQEGSQAELEFCLEWLKSATSDQAEDGTN